MKTASIILFCFNRPDHLKKTVEALKVNVVYLLGRASAPYGCSKSGGCA